MVSRAQATFFVEYLGFLRRTKYSFFDFALCQALKFMHAGQVTGTG